VIEPHATMEHSWVSRAVPRAGPAMVAHKSGPAWPPQGLGPALADNESSWAVPPMNVHWRHGPAPSGGRTRCALLTRYAFGNDTICSWRFITAVTRTAGRDPSGERTCEWTSGRAGVTRS
jgi:hypothetical protein